MPNTRISDLTAAVTVAGTDVFPSVQTAGVGPVKSSLTQVTNYALANAAAGAASTPSIAPSGDSNTGIWFPAADTVAISTNGAEQFRLASTGNTGFGTSTTTYRITLAGDSGAQYIGLARRTTAASVGNDLNFTAGGATSGSTDKNGGNVVFTSGTSTGTGSSSLQFWTCPAGGSGSSDNVVQQSMTVTSPTAGNTYVGIYNQSPANNIDIGVGSAGIRFGLASGSQYYDFGRDTSDGYFKFNGAQATFVGYKFFITGVEQARIDNNGYMLLGYATSNGAYRLQVNSQIFATSATIATSDARYKENVRPLTGALAMVQALNPVSFDWKPHPIHAFDTNTNTVGFLAQEVETALADKPFVHSIVKASECVLEPEVLDEDFNVVKPAVTEPFLGIAEGNMVAILAAAIKELKAEFDAYKASHP